MRWDKDILLISSTQGKVMDAVDYEYSTAQSPDTRLYPIQNSYVVYFDPETATLGRGESRILDQIAREVKAGNPRQVTVTSYADTFVNSGSQQQLTDDRAQALFLALKAFGISAGNQTNAGLARGLNSLAGEQENVVSQALLKRNVPNKILDSRTRGPLENNMVSENDWDIQEAQMVVVDIRD